MTVDEENSAKKCLGVIAYAANQVKRTDYPAAEKGLLAALVITRELAPEDRAPLHALALYWTSVMLARQKRVTEARKMQGHADAAFPDGTAGPLVATFQASMAEALMELGEFKRALPFCERSIELVLDWDNRVVMLEVLWRAGKCYARCGLRDHAVVPLREALKLLRMQAADPRLPAILLEMGSVLRKSSPAEAEQYYKESAEWHESRGHLESAAPAWVNLGVLCSETGRLDEALAYYQRVLRIREQTVGTPPERLGILLNNIANCYRRMGRFDEAFQSVDRATPLLEQSASRTLPHAFGTRGLIFRDAGRDGEAVEWFRKASAQFATQPSPNLETIEEEFKNEAEALHRLGRLEEEKIAEEKAASVRASREAIRATDHDLSAPQGGQEGAVIIELDFGSRPGRAFGPRDSSRLADELAERASDEDAGYHGGTVTIPEATTLMFYGEDGDALFKVLEPVLRREPMCRGARVTIRQRDRQWEVLLPAGAVS